jgi:hypothetical protein
MKKKEEQALLVFERKIFRRIYGPKYENGEWRNRTNRELEEMSKGKNVVKWIKGQGISWLGHLERMEENRMPKMIFSQEHEGPRRKGRPRKRWKDEVERDFQLLGVRRWKELMTDRKKWQDIVRQATAGCSVNGRSPNSFRYKVQVTPFVFSLLSCQLASLMYEHYRSVFKGSLLDPNLSKSIRINN